MQCYTIRYTTPRHAGPVTRLFQSSSNATKYTTQRILYYNTHAGAASNMAAVARAMDITLDSFSPAHVSGYGMSGARAKKLLHEGHVDAVCGLYDTVIIADTIPHGRAILLSLLQKVAPQRCRARVVVEITNRFDWDVKDKRAYYKMFRELIKLSTLKTGRLYGQLFWVANNNVEQRYMEDKLGIWMPKGSVRIIRPVGYAGDYSYPSDLEVPDTTMFAARTHDTTHIFEKFQTVHHVPLIIFPFNHNYGGPKNLLKFKGWIDVPYQYSVMKFYENIAYGVPQFIPTPMFFEYLMKSKLHFTHCIFIEDLKNYVLIDKKHEKKLKKQNALNTLQEPPKTITNFPEWSAYMDYYDPVFAPYVYYFDSYDDLRNQRLLESTREVDWKRVRELGPRFYKKYRDNVVLKEWSQLFQEMGFETST
ncbi:hypothetical protein HK100_001344 [Physocladia obscura]|uniref:Glycosyltransferase n=1 Tax=Physocladia obscura TaxID=109957 RepID=A0AAD5T2X8_9FUNG|nr:hypothetical protein HK100_001344 [Physocladia obscura]